jgi:hypothetical protein
MVILLFYRQIRPLFADYSVANLISVMGLELEHQFCKLELKVFFLARSLSCYFIRRAVVPSSDS